MSINNGDSDDEDREGWRQTEDEFRAFTEAPTEIIPDRGVRGLVWAYRILLALGVIAFIVVLYLSR